MNSTVDRGKSLLEISIQIQYLQWRLNSDLEVEAYRSEWCRKLPPRDQIFTEEIRRQLKSSNYLHRIMPWNIRMHFNSLCCLCPPASIRGIVFLRQVIDHFTGWPTSAESCPPRRLFWSHLEDSQGCICHPRTCCTVERQTCDCFQEAVVCKPCDCWWTALNATTQ